MRADKPAPRRRAGGGWALSPRGVLRRRLGTFHTSPYPRPGRHCAGCGPPPGTHRSRVPQPPQPLEAPPASGSRAGSLHPSDLPGGPSRPLPPLAAVPWRPSGDPGCSGRGPCEPSPSAERQQAPSGRCFFPPLCLGSSPGFSRPAQLRRVEWPTCGCGLRTSWD